MRKFFILVTIALISLITIAQTKQVVWLNGRAVLGQPITQVDSMMYGDMSGSDTLFLLLPRVVVVHDTVFVPYKVAVHDTVYIYKCDSMLQDSTKGYAPAGVEMVDLGLSVKWANMNVGATTVTGCGDYFAWGETSPKTEYSWSTYKYCNGSFGTITKYCFSSNYDTLDNKTTLEAEDDAAHVNWGGNWRMPTNAELKELLDNCTITWTSNYQGTGVAGRIFTSKKTGYTDKTIFLLAAGYRDDTSINNAGSSGHYWSSSLKENYSSNACGLRFSSDNVYNDYRSRSYGRSVRAVCP